MIAKNVSNFIVKKDEIIYNVRKKCLKISRFYRTIKIVNRTVNIANIVASSQTGFGVIKPHQYRISVNEPEPDS